MKFHRGGCVSVIMCEMCKNFQINKEMDFLVNVMLVQCIPFWCAALGRAIIKNSGGGNDQLGFV